MTRSPAQRQPASRAKRLGLAGAALVAGVLALVALSWLVLPGSTSMIFGVELDGTQQAYGRVKGAEDLLAAAVIGLCLCRRDTRAVSAALLVSLIVPVGDLLALLLAGVYAPVYLIDHLVFIVVMGGSAVLLRSSPLNSEIASPART